jgi:hypothetical protein
MNVWLLDPVALGPVKRQHIIAGKDVVEELVTSWQVRRKNRIRVHIPFKSI